MSTILEEVNQLWEHNKKLFGVQPRKVRVQRAGSHYKARFDGEASCAFGATPHEAAARLKALPWHASNKLKFATQEAR
jgi:hypothetical protein